ncbi:MAG: DUF3037 domain-containing protein [Muribaculaceae bacterium]|nr:DUF3037 domain-containing protein [Muribaculaceae bacterium]
MTMDEKVIYEYCVLRYVADVEREEFVNVGLMMMSKRHRWIRCATHIDERRIAGMFRAPDTGRLRCQLGIFTSDDVPAPDLTVEERYRWLAAVKSAVIQTSPSHPGIIPLSTPASSTDIGAMLDSKFEELFRRLVM